MFNFKLNNSLKNWFWIQPQSYKKSNVAINQNEPELEPEPEIEAKRKMALQVEEDLRRIKERIYLLRPNVF
ncbi:hypothetical protein NOS3756_44240 [Nostoc sp. NIES-3756]|jgi:hypothetical protein|uniref:hypothetical protein n=1 Tax=Nostoc sp. NIES-3756 TaxID=1751286 RepID=UPI00071F1FA6|nr:hypothetical protein [Nostoc sp. NIES-3756]BAT55437.1 hypothetical protein NOS3756_44240 [Nostoc sp. NIES-3756]BAY36801.1 hypothetical protein NIES2111_11320 [Nostoc sp. NIES-2111]